MMQLNCYTKFNCQSKNDSLRVEKGSSLCRWALIACPRIFLKRLFTIWTRNMIGKVLGKYGFKTQNCSILWKLCTMLTPLRLKRKFLITWNRSKIRLEMPKDKNNLNKKNKLTRNKQFKQIWRPKFWTHYLHFLVVPNQSIRLRKIIKTMKKKLTFNKIVTQKDQKLKQRQVRSIVANYLETSKILKNLTPSCPKSIYDIRQFQKIIETRNPFWTKSSFAKKDLPWWKSCTKTCSKLIKRAI